MDKLSLNINKILWLRVVELNHSMGDYDSPAKPICEHAMKLKSLCNRLDGCGKIYSSAVIPYDIAHLMGRGFCTN